MIGFLRGRLHAKGPRAVVVDVAGVGYEVEVPASTMAALPAVGEEVELFTHLSWREEGVNLYGFATPEDREVFRLLIEVSGVGPRLAMTILSSLTARQLLEILASGDEARLKSIHGIGKKTAARLCVDLKERAGRLFSQGWEEDGAPGRAGEAPVPSGLAAEAVSALVNLGYGEREARGAVEAAAESLGPQAGIEALITESLRRLAPFQGA